MRNDPLPWTLESLIDFEQEVGTSTGTPQATRMAVVSAVHGLEGATARRVGLRVWLEEIRKTAVGKNFTTALSLLGAGLMVMTFLIGITAVLGLVDHERRGINVVLFSATLVGGQWLILLIAFIAWMVRGRAAQGFSGVQALVGKLARRIARDRDNTWWKNLMDMGGQPRTVVLWRLARMVQVAGVFFNIGILTGLAALVLVKDVGFFWETTTEHAMRAFLSDAMGFLSAPWASVWPDAVPSGAVIDHTRWLSSRTGALVPGPSTWWEFLLMLTFFWGLMPRAILWLLAWNEGRKALANLDFQGRRHRTLWRELVGNQRVETDEKPLDGVLVLDVGGCGLTLEQMRPFLLRRLRVHPVAWHSVAVLDVEAENEAALALQAAPAGVVLLAEAWSLSPPRMSALHAKIRASIGSEIPVKFVIVNVDVAQQPIPPTAAERHEWERFVDSLRDPAAEIFSFEDFQPVV